MKIFDSFDGSEVMTVEQISGRVGADGLLIGSFFPYQTQDCNETKLNVPSPHHARPC